MAASRKFPSFHFHIPYHSGVCVCVCFFFSSVFSSASCSFVFCFCILYDVHHLIFILFRLCSCEFMHVYECLKPPQGIDANEICMWAFFDVQQLSTFTFRQLTTDILLCFVSCISKRNKQVKKKNLKLPLRNTANCWKTAPTCWKLTSPHKILWLFHQLLNINNNKLIHNTTWKIYA